MQPTIIFDKVSKKFSRGYISDSLRDAVAASFKNLFGGNGRHKLVKNKKDEFWALDDVSFEVGPGEAVGIIGSNGSGKSTTLKLLSRILKPDGGRIMVRGRVGALIELAAGFHPDFTGRENVFLNATILGMSKEEIMKKYDEIVDFAELHEFMDMPVKWYSSGMYARLGFAVATYMNPDVLLVDEVLSVGDIGFQRKCFDKIKAFKENGTTVVFISHNMSAVTSLCDRVLMLNYGKLVYEGTAAEVVKYYLDSVLNKNEEGGVIQVIEGNIYDENGNPCNTFKSGQKSTVVVKIKANRDCSDILVSINIRTKDDVLAFGINTAQNAGASLMLRTNEQFRIEMDATLNLGPGQYDCFLWVYDIREKHTLIRQRLFEVIIEEDLNFKGISFLDPKIRDMSIT